MDHPPGHPLPPGVAHRPHLCPVALAQAPMDLSTAPQEILVQALLARVEWAQQAPLQCQVLGL